jgi:hypothetical protein
MSKKIKRSQVWRFAFPNSIEPFTFWFLKVQVIVVTTTMVVTATIVFFNMIKNN